MPLPLKHLAVQILFLVTFLSASIPASAALPGFGSDDSPAEITNLDQIPKDEADSYLATLTDKQVRELLVSEFRNRPDSETPSMMDSSYISYMIMSLKERSEKFETGFQSIGQASKNYGSEFKKVLEKVL